MNPQPPDRLIALLPLGLARPLHPHRCRRPHPPISLEWSLVRPHQEAAGVSDEEQGQEDETGRRNPQRNEDPKDVRVGNVLREEGQRHQKHREVQLDLTPEIL